MLNSFDFELKYITNYTNYFEWTGNKELVYGGSTYLYQNKYPGSDTTFTNNDGHKTEEKLPLNTDPRISALVCTRKTQTV